MTSDTPPTIDAAAPAWARTPDALRARRYAVAAHGAQRYGDQPYVVHLDAVAALAAPYGDDAVTIAYLHDTVEDTAVTAAEVEAQFGARVAACVALLTDPPGATRKERKAETYARLARVGPGPTELALVVKAADRLANVRACVRDHDLRLWQVYRGEQAVFEASARRLGLCEPLWAELATLLADGAIDALPRQAPAATGAPGHTG